jgi:hypothetical protein
MHAPIFKICDSLRFRTSLYSPRPRLDCAKTESGSIAAADADLQDGNKGGTRTLPNGETRIPTRWLGCPILLFPIPIDVAHSEQHGMDAWWWCRLWRLVALQYARGVEPIKFVSLLLARWAKYSRKRSAAEQCPARHIGFSSVGGIDAVLPSMWSNNALTEASWCKTAPCTAEGDGITLAV